MWIRVAVSSHVAIIVRPVGLVIVSSVSRVIVSIVSFHRKDKGIHISKITIQSNINAFFKLSFNKDMVKFQSFQLCSSYLHSTWHNLHNNHYRHFGLLCGNPQDSLAFRGDLKKKKKKVRFMDKVLQVSTHKISNKTNHTAGNSLTLLLDYL